MQKARKTRLWRHGLEIRQKHGNGIWFELAVSIPKAAAVIACRRVAFLFENVILYPSVLGEPLVYTRRTVLQVTADASHELRAPVSLIRTTAEVATQRERTGAEYREALDEILEESERTSQVLDSLLLLARADSGKEALECTASDLCDITRSASEQGEKLARSHKLSFTANLPDRPVSVLADKDALRRALLILMDNAVRYTVEGGVIVNLSTRDGHAIVSVADTGIGIAQEDLPQVFDRFWRADKARSRGEGGAGLRLSIARWIIDRHRGTIGVESELGVGTTFTIKLPRLISDAANPGKAGICTPGR